MSWQLRVGAVQMRSTEDLARNLTICADLTGRAAADGARLVVLPECFAFLGRGEGDKLKIAESLDGTGPVIGGLPELPSKHRIWLAGGGTPPAPPGVPQPTDKPAP